jgi:hypothetical protein
MIQAVAVGGRKEERGAKTSAGELECEPSRWAGPFYRESATVTREPSALSSVLSGGLAITRPTRESEVPRDPGRRFRRPGLSLGAAPSH